MLYKIRKNKTLIFLLYFLIFTLILHFSSREIQEASKIINYIMVSNGCKLEKLTISGNKMFSTKEINDILSPFMGENTFTLPLKKIQALLLKNPWCKNIIIIRKLPNEIIIKLEEHKAFALINDETIVNREFHSITSISDLAAVSATNANNSNNIVVEDSLPRGPLLKPAQKEDQSLKISISEAKNSSIDDRNNNTSLIIDNELNNLLYIKANSRIKAKNFIDELASFSKIFAQVKSAEVISNRRWDILLKNGLLIKLPEPPILPALQQIMQLEEQQNILLLEKIKILDFRLADKLFIELSPKSKYISSYSYLRSK